MERGRNGGDSLSKALHVVGDRVWVAAHLAIDLCTDLRRLGRIVQQCVGVRTDHSVDDELDSRQPHTVVGDRREVESAIRIRHVEHQLHRRWRHTLQIDPADHELEHIGINVACISFGTGNGDLFVLGNAIGGVVAPHHGRDSQFAGDDGCVAGASVSIGDDGGSAFHDGLPVGIGHVRHQHITRLHPVHFRY